MFTFADSEAMNLLLENISAQVPPGTHAVILIDNAGWHTSRAIRVPANLTLLNLPPYSPELNAIERVWLYLKDTWLSGRVFPDVEDVMAACCIAWNALLAETGRIASLTSYSWALVVT